MPTADLMRTVKFFYLLRLSFVSYLYGLNVILLPSYSLMYPDVHHKCDKKTESSHDCTNKIPSTKKPPQYHQRNKYSIHPYANHNNNNTPVTHKLLVSEMKMNN